MNPIFSAILRTEIEKNSILVPVANKKLEKGTEITKDDIDYINVSEIMIENMNIIKDEEFLIGKYVDISFNISKGSMFYEDLVVDEKHVYESLFSDIPVDYTIYPLEVKMDNAYFDLFQTGDVVDIYVEFKDELGLLNFGQLVEAVDVLDIINSESKTLLLSVPKDVYILLGSAEKLDMVLSVVPKNKEYSVSIPEVTNDYVLDYIESKTYIN